MSEKLSLEERRCLACEIAALLMLKESTVPIAGSIDVALAIEQRVAKLLEIEP